MNRFHLLAAATIIIAVPAAAQTSISTVGADGRTTTATAVTPYIIRVDNCASGENPAEVQSVLSLTPMADAAHLSASGTSFTTTAGITAKIDSDGSLSISSAARGTTIVDSGARRMADGKTSIALATSATGSYYGAGERGHKFNLRGDTLTMYNRQNYGYTGDDPRISQMNITMPLFLASEGFAIVFDDYAAATMALTDPIVYTTESRKPVTYYYIGGCDNLADLTEQLTELTGRQPMPPLWSLGYITSKYGYRTQAETTGVIDTLRTQGYPVDGIVLDLYWYGKEEDMGRLAWDPEQWPDHKGMLRSLDSLGVKVVAISQPYVLRNGRAIDNYNALAPTGIFVADSTGGPQEVKIWVGEGAMFDVSNPATRRWLADRYEALTDEGMGGWWGDLGEPEVHPESGLHHNGLTAREYHNKYGNDWSSIISELYAEKYPDRRLMTLMRGGTTGLQRHSVFPWSTDVSRSWGGLEPQIRIMLNSGLSGLGYMSSDLGGFAVDPKHAYMPELYRRWVHAGLFTPVFRTHATRYAEPYHYPDMADDMLAIVKERYRWLPYNYTLAYENARYGWPLVRPLGFADGTTAQYDAVPHEYLWGADVLVAPIVTPGSESREVRFPAGSEWIDFNNPRQRFEGGSLVDYNAGLGLPLFVREGAIIPLCDTPMQNTGDYKADNFTIYYFASENVNSKYTLYDDNRLTPATLADGTYRLLNIFGAINEGKLVVDIAAQGGYEGAPDVAELTFVVELPAGYTDGKVRVDVRNNRERSRYNAIVDNGSLTVPVTFHFDDKATAKIEIDIHKLKQ